MSLKKTPWRYGNLKTLDRVKGGTLVAATETDACDSYQFQSSALSPRMLETIQKRRPTPSRAVRFRLDIEGVHPIEVDWLV